MPLFESELIVGANDLGHDVKFFGAASGKHLLWDQSSNHLLWKDNTIAVFGDGSDLQIYHDGTQNLITSNTSHIKFLQSFNDGDIIFQSDNGSGGVATYLTIDGGVGYTTAHKNIRFLDDVVAQYGTGGDLRMYHDGSNSYIEQAGNGSLIITQTADNADIVLKSDDGSGGVAAYLTLDGSASTLEAAVQTNFASGVTIDGHLDFGGGTAKTIQLGSQRTYTLPAQGTRMRVLTLADHTYCRVFLESSENAFSQPIVLDIHHRAQGDQKPTIVRSENYQWHVHSNDIRFTSDSSGGAGGATHIYFEKVSYSTGRSVSIRKVETFDGTCTILDGSTTNTGGGAEEAISGRFSSLQTAGDITVGDDVFVADNGIVNFGSSNDLQIKHDGTNSSIINATGDLTITNSTNDKDLILLCDDGSNGVTAYLTLDGSLARTEAAKDILFLDDVAARFGNSADLTIFHDASNSYMAHGGTGDLYIQQNTNDKDLVLQCDNGSGGTTAYITLDGSVAETKFNKSALAVDDVFVGVGNGSDLYMVHDGTNSSILNTTGNLTIQQNTDDGDIIFRCDDGSGGTETYFFLDGSAGGGAPVTKFPDGARLQFGDGGDSTMTHDGSNFTISTVTGDFRIKCDTNDGDVKLQCDDGNGGVTDYLVLDGGDKTLIASVPVVMPARKLSITTTTHGNANGDVVYFGGTTSMTVGKIYYYNASGNWALTDADAVASADGMIGVALGAASDTNGVLLKGMVTLDHDPGTVGDPIYLSGTAGQATSTAPSGSGDIVRVVGYCVGSTNGEIYFNPSGTFVEVA